MTVRERVAASCTQVWEVIADGWTYSQWVVGNSRMRAADESWPSVGAVVQHSIGVWPLVVDDETIVERVVEGEEIVLLAKLSVLGNARITLRLFDDGQGCVVEMTEVPVDGPMSLIPNRLAALAVQPRNRECLRRLAALAERRQARDAG